jgi:hypothetical protein
MSSQNSRSNQNTQLTIERQRIKAFDRQIPFTKQFDDVSEEMKKSLRTHSATQVFQAILKKTLKIRSDQRAEIVQELGVAYLSAATLLSLQSVKRGLKKLRELGWIQLVSLGYKNQGCSKYFIAP